MSRCYRFFASPHHLSSALPLSSPVSVAYVALLTELLLWHSHIPTPLHPFKYPAPAPATISVAWRALNRFPVFFFRLRMRSLMRRRPGNTRKYERLIQWRSQTTSCLDFGHEDYLDSWTDPAASRTTLLETSKVHVAGGTTTLNRVPQSAVGWQLALPVYITYNCQQGLNVGLDLGLGDLIGAWGISWYGFNRGVRELIAGPLGGLD
ncbi:hypothetical protein B0H14DRAFT_2638192 [Mycena olivaceomarginata]|nr:hypothetical protein B0H14DRAFT_2638192 [Mycena olivaceomarginata]